MSAVGPRSAARPPLAVGAEQRVARAFIWMRIAAIAAARYADGVVAARTLRDMLARRRQLRHRPPNRKYVKAGGRYFWDLNAPGWPSPVFDAFIAAELERMTPTSPLPGAGDDGRLQSLMLAMTKRCPLRCEHCSEWDVLNERETLSRDDLAALLDKFQQRGVAQILLSGGEPLSRFDDLLALVRGAAGHSDVWVLTSGHGLTPERAGALRAAGLVGVQLSLDHWDPEAHDRFRGRAGSFDAALNAADAARACGLVVCLNLCPTRAFTSSDNLGSYARLAARLGAGFIQLLEPRAIGHYRGQDVELGPDHEAMLDRFYLAMNDDPQSDALPIVTYQGYDQRRVGCYSGGDRFLFIDTDGAAHACPFCRGTAADCRAASAGDVIGAVRALGCQKYAPVNYQLRSPGGGDDGKGLHG